MLHVIYRSTGGTNRKNRPFWFDKDVCLLSMLQAVEQCRDDVDLTFVNDGPIPEHRERLMRLYGAVQARERMGNAGSQRYCFRLARTSAWPNSDVVYFCEDDYLHLPTALKTVHEARTAIGTGMWFTLYDHPDYYYFPVGSEKAAVGGCGWREAPSTCFTFGGSVGLVRSTKLLSWIVTTPRTPRDQLFWRLVQRDGGFRLLPGRAQTLLSALPTQATHAELPHLAPGVDWEAAATEIRSWVPTDPA